jgi:hypothetical protein
MAVGQPASQSLSSEHEFERELERPWAANLIEGIETSKIAVQRAVCISELFGAIGEIVVDCAEHRVIEKIEGCCPELKA